MDPSSNPPKEEYTSLNVEGTPKGGWRGNKCTRRVKQKRGIRNLRKEPTRGINKKEGKNKGLPPKKKRGYIPGISGRNFKKGRGIS